MTTTDLANFITMSHFDKMCDIVYSMFLFKYSRAQFNRNHNHNRKNYITLFQYPLLTALYRKFLKIDRSLV